MKNKKNLSLEEIQEFLDFATEELYNYFVRKKIITVENPTTTYTMEDNNSFVEINVTGKYNESNKQCFII